jgi:RNA polymerase sigma factor (sigma-70 family)
MLDASDLPHAQELLSHLDERSRKIIELRFGMDGYEGPPRTYKQIGKIIGLTRERVRQLEKIALAQLKKLMEDN